MHDDLLVTSISFDAHGFYALEIDGQLVSWRFAQVPECPELETVVTYHHNDEGLSAVTLAAEPCVEGQFDG
ncbi:MAG: hypothetical protein ACYSW8_17380 [Planctomycetota bacterium]|jgi:hypothetical protein